MTFLTSARCLVVMLAHWSAMLASTMGSSNLVGSPPKRASRPFTVVRTWLISSSSASALAVMAMMSASSSPSMASRCWYR